MPRIAAALLPTPRPSSRNQGTTRSRLPSTRPYRMPNGKPRGCRIPPQRSVHASNATLPKRDSTEGPAPVEGRCQRRKQATEGTGSSRRVRRQAQDHGRTSSETHLRSSTPCTDLSRDGCARRSGTHRRSGRAHRRQSGQSRGRRQRHTIHTNGTSISYVSHFAFLSRFSHSGTPISRRRPT